MDVCHIDFETRSAADLKKVGLHIYARHHTTDVIIVCYCFGDGPIKVWLPLREPMPDDLKNHAVNGGVFGAHNAQFEIELWNCVIAVKHKVPKLYPDQFECTMVMAYAMGLPGSLENVAAALGLEFQKDMKGARVMLQLAQPREVKPDGTIVWWDDETKFNIVIAYCIVDVQVERAAGKRLMRLSSREKEVWLLDQKINNRGVRVDTKAVAAALKLVEFEKKRCDEEMRVLTDNAVGTCTATGQLTDWIRSKGIELDGVAKADVTELLSQELPIEVRRALILRQASAKSSTAKLTPMLASANSEDERVRGCFQYHAAGTGRFGGRRVQFHNFPRPKIEQDEIENIFKILGEIHA